MDTVFPDLLLLLVAVWSAGVLLRTLGLPTVMGELVMGVLVGPAVLGWVEPSETIDVLAQLGVFFLLLHTGVQTDPKEFFSALRISLGVALVGALVPFTVSTLVALAFGVPYTGALFVGLTLTATAVVVTLKALRDLGLEHTRLARVVVASSVIDALFSLLLFSVVLGIVERGVVAPLGLLGTTLKATAFFAATIAVGRWVYPLFRHPFRHRQGKGFTFVLVLALAFGLLAEAIGLHVVLGAYMAGLFFREEVASAELVQKVEDRLNGIAYSFLGPVFFVSLGFHVTFEALRGRDLALVLALAGACAIGQVLSAGGMARRLGFTRRESLAVGFGMRGRAEMAFVLASLGLRNGALREETFSVLLFAIFLLNLVAPLGLALTHEGPARRAPSPPAP